MRDIHTALRTAVGEPVPVRSIEDILSRSRQIRRRRGLLAATLCAAVAGLTFVATSTDWLTTSIFDRERTSAANPPSGFPGQGRLLVARGGNLLWVHRDGREDIVASGYSGAILSGNGDVLIGWKSTEQNSASERADLYVIDVHEGHERLLARADESPLIQQAALGLSPDGEWVSYVRQRYEKDSGTLVEQTLEIIDTESGEQSSFGSLGAGVYAWADDSSQILIQERRHRALEWISIPDGSRTAFMDVSDPRVVAAYERVWPDGGPPTYPLPLAVTNRDGHREIAIALTGSSDRDQKYAVALIYQESVLAVAPDQDRRQFVFSWVRPGTFALQSFVGDSPGSGMGVYVGSSSDGAIRKVDELPSSSRIVAPANQVVLAAPSGLSIGYGIENSDGTRKWRFITSRGDCQSISTCEFQSQNSGWRGRLLAWTGG